MISLGIVDIVLLVILVAAVVVGARTHQMARFWIVLVVVLIIMVERLAPGTLAAVGTAIRGIDRVNDLAPHININPVITIQ